ncbi:MAG: MFS transporter [Rhizobiaceae bacterium]|nr:MFS transporter [Rhizobiaceae bacterium]
MTASPQSGPTPPSHALFRWYLAFGLFGVPQAAGPIAFALIALPLTGDAKSGASIVVVMTIAQVLGAMPIARIGQRYNIARFLRALVAVRMIALLMIAGLAAMKASFDLLLVAGAFAGVVNGAAYGYIRAILNFIVTPANLPKALGIGATLNEVTFVAAPVLAAWMGSVSPPISVAVIALLGAGPLFLVSQVEGRPTERTAPVEGALLKPAILAWLLCSASGGAIVATIEVGAVSLALDFGLRAELGIIFTVALCVASISGGVWVTVRNRMAGRSLVIGLAGTMTAGAVLVAWEQSVALTVVGCAAAGLALAPLGTHYSLILDTLAPPSRRPEVFALLRTSNALGVIFASSLLACGYLSVALIVAGTLLLVGAWQAMRLSGHGRGRETCPASEPKSPPRKAPD